MAYTYDNAPVIGGTAAQQRDAVRFLAQDNVATMRVSDEEIAFLLASEANEYMAAAMVAETVAVRVGAVKSKSVDGLSVTYGPEHWTAIAKSLRARGSSHQLPQAVLTESDRETLDEDTDLVQPTFRRDLHENPETGSAPWPETE